MSVDWKTLPIAGEEDERVDWQSLPVAPDNSAKKSQETLSNLKHLNLPLALSEAALTVGSSVYDMIASGAAGAVGTVAGMVPGGESPSEKGQRYYDNAKGMYQYEPRMEGTEEITEAIGTGAEWAMDKARMVPAGLAGGLDLATGQGVDVAAERVADFREPGGMAEQNFQATQSPAWATAVQVAPEMAFMGAPGASKMKPKPKTPRYPESVDIPEGYGGVDDVAKKAEPKPEAKSEIPPEAPVSKEIYEQFQEAIAQGDEARVRELVNANPAMVGAFERLGIEFTPGMVSEAAPVRNVEAGMHSAAGSTLPDISEGVKTQLQAEARKLIDDSGGSSTSRIAVGENIEAEFQRLHMELLDEGDVVWKELLENVDRAAEVDMRGIADALYAEAELLGKGDVQRGVSRLSKHEKELFGMTHNKRKVFDPDNPAKEKTVYEYDAPPYELVDRHRKKLGLGMKSDGVFADAGSGELSYRYGQMAEAQGRVADDMGYGELRIKANESTIARKELEDAMERTFGNRLQKSAIVKVNTATNNLMKGDPKLWDELFDDLPASQRPAAAAAALENIMFTAGRGTTMSEGFIMNFNKIRRDPQLQKRLFSHLPAASRAKFMDLGTAAAGFFRSTQKINRSNTTAAREVMKAIEEGTLIQRMLSSPALVTRHIPILKEMFTEVAGGAKKARGAKRVNATIDLLTSDSLRKAIAEYAAGRPEIAERLLTKDPSFIKWEATVDKADALAIAKYGPIAFLIGQENQ